MLQRGYNLIRELGKRNQVHLLAFVHPDVLSTTALVEESKAELGQHCEFVEYFTLWPKKSRLHRVAGLAWGALSRLPFSALAHRSHAFRARVDELAASGALDLVHYDTLALAQYADLASGTPKVLTHHNIESQLMERRAAREAGAAARWYVRQQARKIRDFELNECRRFDLNVLVSEVDALSLTSMLPGLRVAVVPNGVDTDYFEAKRAGGDENAPSLIYTGGMNMFANRDAVLYFASEVWPSIRREVPGARFYAVGQDPPVELRKLAEADRSVIVTGYVDDIRPLVAAAAVYVVPLRVGGGTRLKILDAMAMRRAIVSTSVGAEGIRATPGRHIVIADEPGDFARRTVELLRDPARRRLLGDEARALVEREYAWGIVARRLEEAYEAAVAASRGREGGQRAARTDSQCAA